MGGLIPRDLVAAPGGDIDLTTHAQVERALNFSRREQRGVEPGRIALGDVGGTGQSGTGSGDADAFRARQAAISAGYTRLRPVLMTAGAMILGMVPMALGIGEGGEQNAPLGRAVIGGLLFATFATLIFVPTMYRLLRRQPSAVTDLDVKGRANAIA